MRFVQADGLSSSLITTQVFRDISAWYHILVAVDTTQGTSSNRIKLYVNGTQITTFSTETYPSSSYTGGINNTVAHNIGRRTTGTDNYLSAYLTECILIDGQALTPSSFTETSLLTGQLIPKTYSGSYGTNGFKLNFSSNASTAALGTDSSGNNNTWAVNNFSVTAGAGNDSLVDTPTSYGTDTGVGAEVRGNYATLNPLDISTGGTVTLSNGNLDWQVVNGNGGIRGTFAVSTGKWYFEFTYNEKPSGGGTAFGVLNVNDALGLVGSTSGGYTYYSEGVSYTKKINNNVQTDYGVSFAPGDVIGVALDLDAGTIAFYKNGASQGQAFSGLSGTFAPACSSGTGTGTARATLNAGQRAFAYTAPSGFKALVDTNLTAPAIVLSNTAFDTKLYTGNGSTNVITGLGFSPDFVWLKNRSDADGWHQFRDIVRGGDKNLASNSTIAESDASNKNLIFDSAGFTLTGTTGSADDNQNGDAYVAWAWDAGTSTVTNTSGSISAQVRANPTAGFSVITYTGNISANQTIGHGLGVAPQFIIVKRRSSTEPWYCYHKFIDATVPADYDISLNSTAARRDYPTFGDTLPTSTVFSVGQTGATNETGETYVAYCFSPVSGYSSFGSYVGNGSSDGVLVYTGMRPRFILVKCTTLSDRPWKIFDTSRDPYNGCNHTIYPNASDAETTAPGIRFDLLSNGFKLRTTGDEENGSGQTYIYYAVAESPFAYSRAR